MVTSYFDSVPFDAVFIVFTLYTHAFNTVFKILSFIKYKRSLFLTGLGRPREDRIKIKLVIFEASFLFTVFFFSRAK